MDCRCFPFAGTASDSEAGVPFAGTASDSEAGASIVKRLLEVPDAFALGAGASVQHASTNRRTRAEAVHWMRFLQQSESHQGGSGSDSSGALHLSRAVDEGKVVLPEPKECAGLRVLQGTRPGTYLFCTLAPDFGVLVSTLAVDPDISDISAQAGEASEEDRSCVTSVSEYQRPSAAEGISAGVSSRRKSKHCGAALVSLEKIAEQVKDVAELAGGNIGKSQGKAAKQGVDWNPPHALSQYILEGGGNDLAGEGHLQKLLQAQPWGD